MVIIRIEANLLILPTGNDFGKKIISENVVQSTTHFEIPLRDCLQIYGPLRGGEGCIPSISNSKDSWAQPICFTNLDILGKY